MNETYDLKRELTLLDPKAIRLSRNDFEELCLEAAGKEPVGPLTVERAFPVRARDEFLRLKDADGGEVGIIRRLSELDPQSRAVLADELQWAYFAALITRVSAVRIRHHVPRWTVETDRGPRSFEIRSTRRDIRVLPEGRVLIRDADGNRYEIPDRRLLDAASRALVDAQI
jgi:hypothetical protein